jgi:hypothetical protein
MQCSEPVLLRYEFEVGPTRSPAAVCLSFPKHAQDRWWTCSFQFQGVRSHHDQLKDGHVYRVTGIHGLAALIDASNAVRARFDEIADVRWREVPYELVFPRFLPTSPWYGLYDWAKEFVADEIELETNTSSPAPPVERLLHTTWNEPTLLNKQFEFAGGAEGRCSSGISKIFTRTQEMELRISASWR